MKDMYREASIRPASQVGPARVRPGELQDGRAEVVALREEPVVDEDVVEVVVGLVLSVLGAIIANTHGLQNIDYLYYWQNK
mgnify:CR=1 FL=1